MTTKKVVKETAKNTRIEEHDDTSQALANIEIYVKEHANSRKLVTQFHTFMQDIARLMVGLAQAEHETLTHIPADETYTGWLDWLNASSDAIKSKDKVALLTRASVRAWLDTVNMLTGDKSDMRKLAQNRIPLSSSQWGKVSALVANYPLCASKVASGEVPLAVYQRLSKLHSLYADLPTIANAMKREKATFAKWLDTKAHALIMDDKKATVRELENEVSIAFDLTEETQAKVKGSKDENRAQAWADRVANGKTALAEIPNDIQARAVSLAQDGLKKRGIVTISQGSDLYPVWAVLQAEQNGSASIVQLENALAVIRRLSIELDEKYRLLKIRSLQEDSAKTNAELEKLGVKVDNNKELVPA